MYRAKGAAFLNLVLFYASNMKSFGFFSVKSRKKLYKIIKFQGLKLKEFPKLFTYGVLKKRKLRKIQPPP